MSYLTELQEHYKAVRKRLNKNAIRPSPPVRLLPPPMPKQEVEQKAEEARKPGLISEKSEKEIICKALRITSFDEIDKHSQVYRLADELVNSPRLPPLPGLVLDEIGAIRWMRILHAVAKNHGVAASEILGNSRKRHVINARFEVFYRLRIDLAMSYTKIGTVFHKDHSTILHGVNKVRKKLLDETKKADKNDQAFVANYSGHDAAHT